MQPPIYTLDAALQPVLAQALGDTPEAVISGHQLRVGIARAYVAGDPARFDAAIIHPTEDSSEPVAFGRDADALWSVLQHVDRWECVNVPQVVAHQLGTLIEVQTGHRVCFYGDVYHTLRQPVVAVSNAAVRLLTVADLAIVEQAPAEVHGGNWPSTRVMLEAGVVAGALIDGELVAIAFTAARLPIHADIGVATLPTWRGKGLATAAAATVIHAVQAAGQTPVWSTGEDNWASLRIAQKLGFTEVARRTYVIRS